MFGRVQLVRATDATTVDYGMDPNFLFPDVDVPRTAATATSPRCFDSPGRTHRDDMDWIAHSFLAVSPVEPGARQVTPLQGFSWGFTRRADHVRRPADACLAITTSSYLPVIHLQIFCRVTVRKTCIWWVRRNGKALYCKGLKPTYPQPRWTESRSLQASHTHCRCADLKTGLAARQIPSESKIFVTLRLSEPTVQGADMFEFVPQITLRNLKRGD
jgi:hypothetical protein